MSRAARFILSLSTVYLANGQSQSSCLVQARFETATAPRSRGSGDGAFSIQQQNCIEDYIVQVRSVWPSYDLSGRHFGGTSGTDDVVQKPPVLGVGFGTTATRSLAVFGRQLGLSVHHFAPYDMPSPHWLEVDELLLQNCSARHGLDAVNFSELISASGYDLLLDTPLGELFLDFYAASPRSKVILTERDAQKWAKSRSENYFSSPLPMQSPCGATTGSLSVEDAGKLFVFHSQLVRCMVPPHQLLDLNVEDTLDSQEIAHFLGVTPVFYVPFPRVESRTHDFFDKSSLENVTPLGLLATSSKGSAYEPGTDRLPVCITGRIRQLELHSKVQRFLKPLMNQGHLLEVYLVLDPRDSSEVSGGHFWSLNDTLQHFPSEMTRIFDPFVASQKTPWEALQRCWTLITQGGAPPNMAVHLRDDLAFLETFVPPLQDMQRGVNAPSCGTSPKHLGLDAAIISGRGEVQTYFNAVDLIRPNVAKPLDKVLFHLLQLPSLPVAFRKGDVSANLCFEKSAKWENCLGEELWRRYFGAAEPLVSPHSQVQYVCETS